MSDDEYGGGGVGGEFEYEGAGYAHPHVLRLNNFLNQYHSDSETRPLSVTFFLINPWFGICLSKPGQQL